MSGGSRRPSLQSNLLAVASAPGLDESWRNDVAQQAQHAAAVVVVASAPDPCVVAAAPPAVAAPRTFMSLSETIASGPDVYQFVPPSCGDECCTLCCPCSAEVRYAAQSQGRPMGAPPPPHDLVYKNSCLICCSGWQAWLGNRIVGEMKHPDCCENGCAYTCCRCLTCSGSATLLNFRNGQGATLYSIRRKMYCCWGPLEAVANVAGCALLCFPICWPVICCGGAQCPCDSCAYMNGDNAVVLDEAIFPAVGKGDEPVGTVRMTEVIRCAKIGPFRLCFPVRTTTNFAVELRPEVASPPLGVAHASPQQRQDETLLLTLLPLMWRGLDTATLIAPSYLRKPSGDGCCNSGRVVQEQRMTFQQALSGGVMQARWANGWGGSLVAGAHDMER